MRHKSKEGWSGETGPTLMFISSSDYSEITAKGVADMMLDRDEGGFFEKVLSVHPWAKSTRDVMISHNHVLLEFGPEWIPPARSSRLLRRMLAPVLVAKSALAVRRTVRQSCVSVVRASDPFWTGLFGWLATKGTGVPLAISIHSDWIQRAKLDPRSVPRIIGSFTLARLMARFNLRHANYVIPIRESLALSAEQLGAPAQKIMTMPHMVEDSLFETRSESHFASDKRPYAFFAGRLSRENYVYDMLECLQFLPRDLELDLVLAGDGVEAEEVDYLVAHDPVLRSRVKMLGSIPRNQVQLWRQNATVNVCLMGGYSLIEAAASARPVISYDIEWHSELIIHNQTGFLIEESDIEGLAAAMMACTNRPRFARQLGEYARRRAYERHAQASVANVRRQVYGRILSQQ